MRGQFLVAKCGAARDGARPLVVRQFLCSRSYARKVVSEEERCGSGLAHVSAPEAFLATAQSQ